MGGLASLAPDLFLSARPFLRSLKSVMGWMGLVLIGVGTFSLSSDMMFPGFAAILPVFGTIAVLLAGTGGDSERGLILSRGLLPRLGRVSYSWYLWHWPVLLGAAAVFPLLSWPGRALAALLALGVAALSYRLVENPIRFNRSLVASPLRSLSLAALIPVLGVSVSYFCFRIAKKAQTTSEQKLLVAAAAEPVPLRKENCIASFGEAKIRECVFGAKDAPISIVLFGDSHAAHWFPALERIALDRQWRLTTLIKSSCPTAQVPVFNPRLRRVEQECDAWRRAALARIEELHPTAVVMSNSAAYVSGPGRYDGSARLSPSQWQEGSRATLGYLDSHGMRAVLIADAPRPGFDVPTCLSRVAQHGWKAGTCDLLRDASLDTTVAHAESLAGQGLEHVLYLDLSSVFCDQNRCPAKVDGQPVYSDSNHLAKGFVERIAPALADRLAPFVVKGTF